jgi:GNAT acetyltransferase
MSAAGKFKVNQKGLKDQMHSPFPLINAVMDGQQEGAVFGFDESGSYFVIHKAAFSYLIMNDSSFDLDGLLSFFVNDKNLPAYFHLYNAPAGLIQACNEKKEWFNCRIRTRIQLKYLQKQVPVPPIPGGFQCKPVDEGNIAAMEIFGLEIGKKFWKSEKDFLQNGFGFVITEGEGRPASICYAACVSGNTAEIDVATVTEFRQKGLAKIVVSAFVNYCIANNIIANWDCFEENTGSLKTATSLGFTTVLTYPFLSIFNKTTQHENN